MRDGLAVSIAAHAALLAWGLFSLPSPAPLDASSIEAIPVNFVQIEDVTSVPKGIAVAKVEEEAPPPEPVKKIVEEPPPLPEPTPPEPTPPPPEPEPLPLPPPPQEEQPETPPPEPQPQPTPEPPPPAPAPEPEAPPPAPEPPPEAAAAIKPMPTNVPLPKLRPPMPAPRPQVAKKQPTDTLDEIAALLDKDQKPAAQPDQPKPALGAASASIDAGMTATELDALRARLAQCWSPPIGWTDPAEVRVVLMLSLNPDGTMSSEPQVLQQPAGRYAQTAAESALRAVRRCAPYALPPDKYESWKQVKVTFDPTEMGGT
jgi:hypothetical protein